MKKIFFSALAALSLAACVQEQVMDVPSGGAIEFQGTFVENATRAAQTVTTANLDAFQVWGFVNAPTGVVFEETTVSKNGGAWSYDGTQYWAPDQHYYFAAVAPLSALWSLNTETANVTGPGVLSFTNDAATDLVYAEKHVQAAGAGQVNPAVALQFQHLLSKVKLTFTNSFGIDNYKVALNGIVMTTPESATIDLTDAHTWDYTGAATKTLAFTSKELANNMTETTVEEYFVFPTACGIEFDLQVYVGTEKVYEGKKTATLPADAFEMGHAYNLSAEINADVLSFEEIVFTVDKVEEWVEAPNTSDAAANLLYAAQMGGVITLEEDVVIDAPVVVPAGVELVLNLNGKTIKNTTQSEVYGEGEGIIAYGDLTINGEGGSVEASTMAVWARGNDGAKVTINGGTYKGCAEGFAKGGRSVIYASSGNTIDIYGGTFQALAADKTSYANKTEGVYAAVNVADNNGNINVYGGTFVNQDPAAPGTEPAAWNSAHPNGFVADGYSTVLKGSGYVVVRQIVADLFDVTENTEVTFTENLPVSNGTTIHTQGATADITIEGNGMSVVSTADSAEDFQWEGGRFPSMSTILSSEDGSLVTVNDLTFEGTMSALMLGHYVDSNSDWYNTELNNVNVVNTKVVSFSSNVAPAVCVYGKATMNNCNVYGTTLSELDTDPMWPVYDVAVVNEAVLTLNDSNIGTIIAWAKSRIIVEAGSVVESIKPIYSSMNTNAKYGIVVKAGATVKALDLTNIDSNKKINITIEDGATVGKIIADGVEYRSLEHYKTATVVDNYPSFAESIKAENSVVYLAEGNYNFGDEKKLLRFGKGTKIYGDNTRIFLDWGSLLIAEQTTLEDVTIEGVNFANNDIMKMAYAKGELYFKDCTFSHIRGNQSIHFDGQAGAKVVFENCTFYGRNMYASALDKVIFINCKFLESTWNTEQGNKGVATGWSGINMWGKYEFNQCQFDKACTCNVKTNGVEAYFNGCTYTDGSDITGVIKNSQNYSATINFN